MKSIHSLITGRKNDTEVMTYTKKIVCNSCKSEYVIPISFIGFECEYGFAAITPCEIYLGEKHIGRLLGGGGYPYRLESHSFHIKTTLTKGYEKCAVYEEAKEIIKGKSKRDHQRETTEIIVIFL